MTLLRLVQRASLLAGMTFATLSVHSTPAHAETEFCVVASNGKTACGTIKTVERGCITTSAGSNVCGKFKSAREGQAQQAKQPIQGTVARKEVDNIVFELKGCRKSDSSVKCELNIANKGTERTLDFGVSSSTLVDFSGKSYSGKVGDLGAQSLVNPMASIASGVEYSASITFENMPEQLVKAQLLNLNFHLSRPIQFRSVYISN
jgi:hypothetical protein